MKIVTAPNPILNRVCTKVSPVDNYMLFCEELQKKMRETPGAVGLAAPQVGEDLQIFCFLDKIAINPTILEYRGNRWPEIEGCLSLPGIRGHVVRNTIIEVEYFKPDGTVVKETLRNWEARVFQHEYDHLFGILIDSKFM